MINLGWLGFWIFAAVLIACDTWIFSKGYNSLFQIHETSEEKELQRLVIELKRLEVERAKRLVKDSDADRAAQNL